MQRTTPTRPRRCLTLSLFIACAAALMPPAAFGAPPIESAYDGAFTRRTFVDAHRRGLTIDGLSDTASLKATIEAHLQAIPLPSDLFDEALARELGFDPRAVQELEELAQLGALQVEVVELVAGLDVERTAALPAFGVQELGDHGGLGAGVPTRQSLVAQGSARSSSSYTFWQVPGSSWQATRTFGDGSVWTGGKSSLGTGDVIVFESTQAPDGSTEYSTTTRYSSDGVELETREETSQGPPQGQAEQARLQGGHKEQPDSNTEAPKEDATPEDEPDKPDGKIDGYQPSGEEGLCPLTIEVCRRGLERARAALEQVRIGILLINPGNASDEPSGARLTYDVGGLVINPSPDATTGTRSGSPRLSIAIPVWINPPGPGES
jgi:hypothetical protein